MRLKQERSTFITKNNLFQRGFKVTVEILKWIHMWDTNDKNDTVKFLDVNVVDVSEKKDNCL